MRFDDLNRCCQAAGSAARTSADAVKKALIAFHDEQRFVTPGQGRYVCFGLAVPYAAEKLLIEDARRFPRVLESAEEYERQPRPFRRMYRGLLHSYFQYDAHRPNCPHIGRSNWQALRDYLERRRGFASEGGGFVPAWVGVLESHRSLLSQNPCAPYAEDALRGDSARFREAQEGLDIPETSWLTREIVLAQLREAAESIDARFKERIGALVGLAAEHALLRDDILKGTLDRYARCDDLTVDTRLRDATVTEWGNPWLQAHAAKWGRVSDKARKMVAGWLKVELITLFFQKLAADGINDRRRVNFWLRYHEHIDDMYFALGNVARRQRDADFKELRQKMGDHQLTLHALGDPGTMPSSC